MVVVSKVPSKWVEQGYSVAVTGIKVQIVYT